MSVTHISVPSAVLTSPLPSPSDEPKPSDEPEPSHHHPQQKPLSVTLDGPSIFGLAAVLLVSIRWVGPEFAEIIILSVPLILVIYTDYQNFLGLGPGGTPSNLYGYLQISWWRLWALRDPYTPPRLASAQQQGILRQLKLPNRTGPRPIVAGIAPQRQLDQYGSKFCYRLLRKALTTLGTSAPSEFGLGRSCIEKHGLALFAKNALKTNCQGEVMHVHDSDHSMHMCLHPDDIKEVLSRGWGQMHPLAQKTWLMQMPVASNFVMIYAPRTINDLDIILKIIEAAIRYTSEEQVTLKY